MKKRLFLIFTALMMILASVPTYAFGSIGRTSSNEYYFWLYKDGSETYEGSAATRIMFNDAGFNTDMIDEFDWNKTLLSSSNKKILTANGPIITCHKTGDVKVTLYGDRGTKVNKVHVYDMKLYPVYQKSKKMTLKARGNLKGCKVLVRIGGKTYKKMITRKNQKISFRIPKGAVGRKIKVRLLKESKELLRYTDHVYYAEKIKKGMSKKNAKETLEYSRVGYNIKKSGNKEIWDCPSYEKVILKNNRVEKVVRKRKINLY